MVGGAYGAGSPHGLESQEPGDVHLGFASSHFFLRFLQVRHPVLDRPLVILFVETTGVRGCLRGLPRGRLAFG